MNNSETKLVLNNKDEFINNGRTKLFDKMINRFNISKIEIKVIK